MIYLFDKYENLIKIVPRADIEEATQTIELNKTISFECEFKKINFDEIEQAEYIGHFYDNNFYLYKILRNEVQYNSTVKGVHIVFDELQSYGYIREKRPKGTAALALSIILDGTRWEIGKIESNTEAVTNWYDKTRLEALSDFASKWGVELDYRIDFDGQKITKRYIDIYNHLGHDTGKRFVYGTNAITVKAETNKSGIYTAVIGRGKGEEKTDEDGNPTGAYGRRINFKEVEWTKSAGKPANKPRGQEYVEIPEATKKFGFSDGQPRVKIEIFEDCDDPEKLLELSYNALLSLSRPLVTFETAVYKIGNVNIGDSVRIIRRDLDLFYTARVFKIERNLLENSLSKIALGDYIKSNAEKEREETKNKINNSISQVERIEGSIGDKLNNLLEDLKEGIALQYYNDNAYNYELGNGNKWKLPAGYYSFDKPIDENPTKVIFFGAGKIMIANKKLSSGAWDWSTFGTGDGFTADAINTGRINGSLITAGIINADLIKAGALKGKNFNLDLVSGTMVCGTKSGRQFKVNADGSVVMPELLVGDIPNDSISVDKLKNGAVSEDKIQYGAITYTKIKDGAITTGKIQSGAITTDKIQSNSITASKIQSGAITADKIQSNSITASKISSGAITTDLLYPGANERIVLERGYGPGSNDAMSIDANGDAIRLKYSASNYVRVKAGSIDFFTIFSNTRTDGRDFWAQNYNYMSDVRMKENIKFLDKSQRIKETDVDMTEISSDDIYSFIRDISFATYTYKFSEKNEIGLISQMVEKYPRVKDYLISESDGRKYINTAALLNMGIVALKKEIDRNDKLEERIRAIEEKLN